MSKRTTQGDRTHAEIALARLYKPAKPKPDATPLDMSRARITVAPAFVDRRYAPEAGHVGQFARDWQDLRGVSRETDPDDEIETEGMGL